MKTIILLIFVFLFSFVQSQVQGDKNYQIAYSAEHKNLSLSVDYNRVKEEDKYKMRLNYAFNTTESKFLAFYDVNNSAKLRGTYGLTWSYQKSDTSIFVSAINYSNWQATDYTTYRLEIKQKF